MGYRANTTQVASADSNALAQFNGGAGAPFGDSLLPSKSQALQRWYYCLGNAANAPCDVMFIGDSITAGYTQTIANRWQTLVRTILRSRFQPAGITGGRGYFPALQAVATASDYPVANTGGQLSNFDGPPGLCAYLSAAGNKLVFTTPAATSVDVIYGQNGLVGAFSYKHDAGSSTTVGPGGATSYFTKAHISGLGGTAHTVEVDWVSGAVFPCGFWEYNGDENAGLRFIDGAYSGSTTANFLANMNWFGDFAVIQPALVMITIGVNDIYATPTITAAQLKANILTIISNIYSNCTIRPSIVLGIEWQVSPNGVPVDTWANAVAAMYQIAAADPNICIFDARSRINPLTPSAAGGLLGDGTHPSQAGGVILANALANFLTP